MDTQGYCVVVTTCGTQEEADRLARSIVKTRLAACVQLANINSYYTWEGKLNIEPEILLWIKTTDERYADLERFISENHSYDVPEIIRLPITAGLQSYLQWINAVTK